MVQAHFYDVSDERITISEIKFSENTAGSYVNHSFVSLAPVKHQD